MQPLIIADASPLIGFAKIGKLKLLAQLYQTVIIPPAVYTELKPNSDYHGAKELKSAIDSGWLIVSERPPKALLQPLQQILDPGESEAIILAQETEGSILIIDERRGRNVATQRQLRIIGTGAVLLAGKRQGYLENVNEPLQAMLGVGYRMSPQLMNRILSMAGEVR